MKPMRRLNRRSFLGRVAGGVTAVGGALLLLAPKARAQPVTDSDPTDPVGRGRGGTGVTDRDPTDPAGRGRGGGSGVTDADPSDPVGRGRGGGSGGAAYHDSDNSDPVGNARRPPRADYVDCERTRERLAEVERIIALVEDEGRFADMQNALARARALADERATGDLFADRDIRDIIEAQGVSCQFASGTGCIPRLESLVADVARARQNSQPLYTERARLWADLQRACGGVNR
jgi:hypothetical protein